MIISYRGSCFGFAIVVSCQVVPHGHSADLLHLVRLGMPASRLKVQDLLNAVLREDVVAPVHAFTKPEAPQQRSQTAEGNRRIRSSPENPREYIARLRHAKDCARRTPRCLTRALSRAGRDAPAPSPCWALTTRTSPLRAEASAANTRGVRGRRSSMSFVRAAMTITARSSPVRLC